LGHGLTSIVAVAGDRVSVSSEDDQATITDDGFLGSLVLSLGIF
jgi:hypothetical protein